MTFCPTSAASYMSRGAQQPVRRRGLAARQAGAL